MLKGSVLLLLLFRGTRLPGDGSWSDFVSRRVGFDQLLDIVVVDVVCDIESACEFFRPTLLSSVQVSHDGMDL